MNCPVCGSIDTKSLLKFDEIVIAKCVECTHEFSLHQKDIDFSIYDESYFESEHKNWFENPNFKLFKKIQSIVEKKKHNDAKVLDIGCGKGDFLYFLKKNGFQHLTGLDLSQNSPDDIIEFIQANIFEHCSIKKYDVVVNLAVIEHLNNLEKFSNSLEKFVEEDGLLVVMTVDSDSALYKMAKFFYKFGIQFPIKRFYSEHHVNHFNKKSLKKLFEKNNFRTIEHFNSNFPIKAIDLDDTLLSPLVRAVLGVVFMISNWTNGGMLQVIILKKTNADIK